LCIGEIKIKMGVAETHKNSLITTMGGKFSPVPRVLVLDLVANARTEKKGKRELARQRPLPGLESGR
jgi:hypothetical protein